MGEKKPRKIVNDNTNTINLTSKDNKFISEFIPETNVTIYSDIVKIQKENAKNNEDKTIFRISDFVCIKFFNFLSDFSCFKSCFINKKLYRYLNTYLNKALDVKNYERIYFEGQMIKMLVLNDDQLKLFNKIPLVSGIDIIEKMETNQEIKINKKKLKERIVYKKPKVKKLSHLTNIDQA